MITKRLIYSCICFTICFGLYSENVTGVENEDEDIRQLVDTIWEKKATVNFQNSKRRISIQAELGHVPLTKELADDLDWKSGKVMKHLYIDVHQLEKLTITVYAERIKNDTQERIRVYYVTADRQTVQEADLGLVGYVKGVRTVIKPWYHPWINPPRKQEWSKKGDSVL